MNYFDLYSSFPDHTITPAWDSQVKEADKTPWLTDTLTECGGELFLRFAACYAELRALPRGARRALQRRIARSSELAVILPEHIQQGGRRLQHRMAWSLAGAALLLALGQGVATAATITVTTNNPNAVADGQCSLIEAIVNANNDAATHADCVAGSGADTVVLPANANVTLSAPENSAYGSTALPLINTGITIEGNGAIIARQGNSPEFRLMAVSSSGDLALQQVTLSGGKTFARGGGLLNYGALNIENSTISGNTANYGGGGIRNSGSLTIQNSTISGNNSPGYTGGGVSNYGTVTIENSTISGNTGVWGGGVFNCCSQYGSTKIINSTISGNAANYSGGGVNNWFGTATIINSTISGNTTGSGSGVFNYGALSIENSTISGNTANFGGGGLTFGSLILTNSTVSNNIANYAGGGLVNSYYCYFGCLIGTLTLNRSLIAGNQAPVAPEVQNLSSVGAVSVVNANKFNLFGANGNAGVTGFTPGPTDIVPAPGVQLAQILAPLANNGGPTETYALIAGSPAIDAGDPGGCRNNLGALLVTDQRGFARHVDGNNDGTIRCDIGAFEFGAEFVPIPPAPLAIAATTIATGEAGVSFTSDLMISGGVAPYIVSITKGKLPKGLTMGNDGIISGTISPTAKSAKITVRITDSLNESITQTFTITVLKALRVAEKAKTGKVGKDYKASFKVKGGLGPFNWSITAGALPMGLSFNTATGAITGIPTQAGTFPLMVQVTDALGGVDAENLTLTVK